MNSAASTDETVGAANADLRARLEDAEETLRAIRTGEVDALVVETSAGPQLFTLQGADAQQSRMLGDMLAQVSDAVIATDLDRNVTFVNPSAEQLMGIRAGDVLGRPLADIYSEQWENPAAEAAMRTALHERGEGRCELIHHMHDGHELEVDKAECTLHAPDGTPIGYLASIRDITARKKAERLLRREGALLQASEVRYRRLFESAKAGILILDAHAATITHANPYITELLGYSPEEMQGKELWQIGLFQDVETSKGAMQELQERGYIRYEDFLVETKVGRQIDVEFICNVSREDGEAVIQCNILDISDRKRLEEILRQHAANLSEANRRKDEFLATLAHELRNPLAPILTAAEILRMNGPAIPELQWALDVIDRQIQAMTRLIDDLMDLSRINQGKIELQKEQVELRRIVQGALETSRPLIQEMSHELTVTLPPGPVIVHVDPTRLAQVLTNLLNNAAKYTERGGRIDLHAELQGGDVLVSVVDTGIGIAAEKLPTLFEMFSQVEGALSRSQGGLGIGLCLVKRLVEMHGGSVEAKSGGLGKGSEFVVRLPIVVAQTYPRPTSDDDKARSISDLRILVVDDNRDCADSLAMMLELMGNETCTAYDGEEAVAAAREFRPDVVLCDIGLPKLNGYEACRQLKAQAWNDGMILIAVTGWGQDDDRQKSAKAGFDQHLVKPVDPGALMKLLAGLLARDDSERAAKPKRQVLWL